MVDVEKNVPIASSVETGALRLRRLQGSVPCGRCQPEGETGKGRTMRALARRAKGARGHDRSVSTVAVLVVSGPESSRQGKRARGASPPRGDNPETRGGTNDA